MTALPQAALPLLRPRRAKKVLYGRKQRQDHNSGWGELLPGSFDSVGLALRFVGGLGVRTDLETGLLYMRHRWYDATLQRFISRDPIGLRGGANLYNYCAISPTNLTDPDGLKPLSTKAKYEAFYQRWSKNYRIDSFEGVEALMPKRRDQQGLKILCKQMRELSECADNNSEFVILLQAAYLPTSAAKKYKAYDNFFFDTSELQDSKHWAIAPGMKDWQFAYQDKLGPTADNTHHLAAFIAAGFNQGKQTAQAAAELIDIGNPGDIALGRLGAEYGDLLQHKQYELLLSGEEQRQYRGKWIKALCDRLGR